jgi:hypothetical protein
VETERNHSRARRIHEIIILVFGGNLGPTERTFNRLGILIEPSILAETDETCPVERMTTSDARRIDGLHAYCAYIDIGIPSIDPRVFFSDAVWDTGVAQLMLR